MSGTRGTRWGRAAAALGVAAALCGGAAGAVAAQGVIPCGSQPPTASYCTPAAAAGGGVTLPTLSLGPGAHVTVTGDAVLDIPWVERIPPTTPSGAGLTELEQWLPGPGRVTAFTLTSPGGNRWATAVVVPTAARAETVTVTVTGATQGGNGVYAVTVPAVEPGTVRWRVEPGAVAGPDVPSPVPGVNGPAVSPVAWTAAATVPAWAFGTAAGPTMAPVRTLAVPARAPQDVWFVPPAPGTPLAVTITVAAPEPAGVPYPSLPGRGVLVAQAAAAAPAVRPASQAPPALALRAPRQAPVGRWVPVTIRVTRGGRPVVGARVQVQAVGDPPQVRQAVVITNRQGLAVDAVRGATPGRVVVTAAWGAGGVAARTTVTLVAPRPWWLLLLLLLLLLILAYRWRRAATQARRGLDRPVASA